MRVTEGYTAPLDTIDEFEPTYLVEIWRPLHNEDQTVSTICELQEYEFTDCQISEVQEWVSDKVRPGDTDVIYVYSRAPGQTKIALIHLSGAQPQNPENIKHITWSAPE